MRHIGADFRRFRDSQHRVLIRAVQIDLSAVLMHDAADIADCLFKRPVGRWVGHHQSTEPFGVYVRVDDVDAHHARAVAAGAAIVRPPADTPYGAREYSARDLEGRLWSFGTYDPYAGAS